MDYLISLLFFVLCAGMIWRMTRARDVVDFQMGVLSVFSIGYYCLPIWFKHLSPLGKYASDEIAEVLLIFFLFGLCVVLGTWIGRRIVSNRLALKTGSLDLLLTPRMRWITIVAFLGYLYYYSTQPITSYLYESPEEYLASRGPLSSLIALFGQLALGWIALVTAWAWKLKRRFELILYSSMLGVCLLLLLFVAQRLALLKPLVTLVAALAITGQAKRAISMLGVIVVLLLLISPIAVFIRQSLAGNNAASSREALGDFSYGDDAFGTMFQSIVDRGDLVYVALRIKPKLDSDPLPGLIYYASVLINPIPRVLFSDGAKPYPLSTNGLPSGELSSYSWNYIIGTSNGSLSAFGGIVAYRELGWVWVILNGLMTGVFFVFLSRWLGHGGGLVPQLFYISLFSNLSIRKVPPSFFEALLDLMPYAVVLIGAALLSAMLSQFRRSQIL